MKRNSIILGSTIITVIIIAGIVSSVFLVGGPYTLIGETTYTYPSTVNLNLTLNIENTAGRVEIEYDNTMVSLIEARLEMWGRSQATIADAKNFTSSTVGDEVVISFNSVDYNWTLFDKTAFYQKLYIKINPDAIAEYNVDVISGSITLDFDSLTECIIQVLDVSTVSGSITVDFGDNTYLNTSAVSIETTSGSINIILQDVKITDDIMWDITTVSGSVALTVDQVAIPTNNYTASFDVSVTSGSVSLNYALDENTFGITIHGSTSSGSITIPGGGNLYESVGYANKTLKYIFELTAVSGSISAS